MISSVGREPRISSAVIPEREKARETQDEKHHVAREVEFYAGSWVERKTLEVAVSRLAVLDELRNDHWKELDTDEKAHVLNSVGNILSEVYGVPRPPLLVKDLVNPHAQGSYGDGYVLNQQADSVEGADYGIQLNEAGEREQGKLFGDDAALALETYAHEFRHSYQAEQVLRMRKPPFRNLVDNPEAARHWQHKYIPPHVDFESYRNQPVEVDARQFAELLVSRLRDRQRA